MNVDIRNGNLKKEYKTELHYLRKTEKLIKTPIMDMIYCLLHKVIKHEYVM